VGLKTFRDPAAPVGGRDPPMLQISVGDGKEHSSHGRDCNTAT